MMNYGKGREGKGREGKGREGKGREGSPKDYTSIFVYLSLNFTIRLALALSRDAKMMEWVEQSFWKRVEGIALLGKSKRKKCISKLIMV